MPVSVHHRWMTTCLCTALAVLITGLSGCGDSADGPPTSAKDSARTTVYNFMETTMRIRGDLGNEVNRESIEQAVSAGDNLPDPLSFFEDEERAVEVIALIHQADIMDFDHRADMSEKASSTIVDVVVVKEGEDIASGGHVVEFTLQQSGGDWLITEVRGQIDELNE